MKLKSEIEDHINTIKETFSTNFIDSIEYQGNVIAKRITKGGKIIFMGNGGSAADSQHISGEFVCKLSKNRKPLPALALTVDTSALTSISNDYGYSQIFSRQIHALCSKNDVVIGISTSGKSQNVINGFLAAKEIGAYRIGFSGQNGFINVSLDHDFQIKSDITARVQEAHIILGHLLCKVVEKDFV